MKDFEIIGESEEHFDEAIKVFQESMKERANKDKANFISDLKQMIEENKDKAYIKTLIFIVGIILGRIQMGMEIHEAFEKIGNYFHETIKETSQTDDLLKNYKLKVVN